jgi:CRISPR-associated endonuclease/helicase Cas3
LSLNSEQKIDPRFCLRQSFKTAGQKMDLIQNDTNGVIVYYDGNDEKIEELIDTVNRFENSYQMDNLRKIKKLSKELQPYTINMQKNDNLNKSVDNRLNGRIQILQESLYSSDMGANESIEGFIF